MSQTELRLRQIKDDKIVGYILIDDTVYYSTTGGKDETWRPLTAICHVGDSFELGIKVGNEWWFEGDIIKCKLCTGELIYDALNGFRYVSHQHGDAVSFAGWDIINQFERIGNIHERERE